MKKVLIVLGVGLLLALGIKIGYEIYMNTREYTAEDLDGVWVFDSGTGRRHVLYIHDGRMDYIRYEKKDESSSGAYDKYIAMTMEAVPEGTFKTFSWWGLIDLERTASQGSTGFTSADNLKFDFKRNRIYEHAPLEDREFVRGKEEDHPHIVSVAKTLDQYYQLSLSQKPLVIDEMQVFESTEESGDKPVIFLCARITNPNPYRIDTVRATLRWEGWSEEVTVSLPSLPANSSGIYVGHGSLAAKPGQDFSLDSAECSLTYNIYEVSTDTKDNPVAEVVDSCVITDEKTGRVKEISVDTKTVDTSDKYNSYELYALFYKQGRIVGAAWGSGRIEGLEQSEVMQFVSDIAAYDNCEISVASYYKTLKEQRK